jgi:hypothetical protein
MVPLCTTTNSWLGEETWGWELRAQGGPWVAQRVCAMPACALTWALGSNVKLLISSLTSFTRSSTLPLALITTGLAVGAGSPSACTGQSTDTPAES